MGCALRIVLLTFGVAALTVCATSNDGADPGAGESAVEAPRPRAEPEVEERAAALLAEMADALKAAKRFSVRAEATDEEFLSTGQAVELSVEVRATVRRPDGLLLERRGDDFHRRVVFDGKHVVLQDLKQNVYARKELPGTIDELLDAMVERFGVTLPLSDLAVADPGAALSEYADWGLYLGIRRVRGTPCHHLAFANDDLEWQVWIQAEGDRVPRKVVILYVARPGRRRFSAHLDDWSLAADVPDEAFAFVPPEGAMEIDLVSSESLDAEPADEGGAEGR
jgi:hypothetical protein